MTGIVGRRLCAVYEPQGACDLDDCDLAYGVHAPTFYQVKAVARGPQSGRRAFAILAATALFAASAVAVFVHKSSDVCSTPAVGGEHLSVPQLRQMRDRSVGNRPAGPSFNDVVAARWPVEAR